MEVGGGAGVKSWAVIRNITARPTDDTEEMRKEMLQKVTQQLSVEKGDTIPCVSERSR